MLKTLEILYTGPEGVKGKRKLEGGTMGMRRGRESFLFVPVSEAATGSAKVPRPLTGDITGHPKGPQTAVPPTSDLEQSDESAVLQLPAFGLDFLTPFFRGSFGSV